MSIQLRNQQKPSAASHNWCISKALWKNLNVDSCYVFGLGVCYLGHYFFDLKFRLEPYITILPKVETGHETYCQSINKKPKQCGRVPQRSEAEYYTQHCRPPKYLPTFFFEQSPINPK